MAPKREWASSGLSGDRAFLITGDSRGKMLSSTTARQWGPPIKRVIRPGGLRLLSSPKGCLVCFQRLGTGKKWSYFHLFLFILCNSNSKLLTRTPAHPLDNVFFCLHWTCFTIPKQQTWPVVLLFLPAWLGLMGCPPPLEFWYWYISSMFIN